MSPDELVKAWAVQLSSDSPPGRLLLACPFISFPSCWTQQEQLGALLLSSPLTPLLTLFSC